MVLKQKKIIESDKDNPIGTRVNRKAHLFGNGINRMPTSGDRYEWGNLLDRLNGEFADGEISEIREKPFPMVYDEIINHSLNNGISDEGEIKRFIRQEINQLQTNNRYNDFRNLKTEEILTTNYDYLIEKSLEENWKREPMSKNEKKYSIQRRQTSSEKNIWHIHGEEGDIRSILLGFRHYIDCSSAVKKRAHKAVNDLKTKHRPKEESWVDLFFTHDIDIIGLGMDFTEYPMWWLLAFRHYKNTIDKRLSINNKIRFVIPSFSIDEKKNLTDMLRAYNVELKAVKILQYGDYNRFYKKILNNDY